MVRRGLGVVLLLVALPAPAAAVRLRLQLEAGAEADSNPLRVDSTLAHLAVSTAAVARTTARLDLSARPTEGKAFGVSLLGAGKKFTAADGAEAADVAVASLTAGYSARLGDAPAALSLSGGYYEAFERGPLDETAPDLRRDFRTFHLAGGLILAGPRGHHVTATVGARRFTYKPDATLDFDGQWLTLAWTRAWGGDQEDPLATSGTLELRGSYTAGRRAYDTLAFTNVCPDQAADDVDCFRGTSIDRTDLYHVAGLDLTHRGARIIGGGYELEWTDSNSFGESLLWHKLWLSATVEAPGQIVVTARAVVQFTWFLDPLFLPGSGDKPVFTIEDENRNTLAIHATRELSGDWGVEARYALSTNEQSEEEASYSRHTLYAGVVWYTMEP